MCYEDDELPPFPPVRGGAESHGDMTLLASDGVEFDAYFAHPDVASKRAVIILPDNRGLGGFYKDLPLRFAEAGMHAVAIDYYTREIGRGVRPLPDDQVVPAIRGTDKSKVDLDAAAAVKWLRELPGASIGSIFTVGFCLGGTFSWHLSAIDDRLQGYVSLYGVTGFIDPDRIPNMRGPLLMLIAGEDRTPPEDVEKLADEIRGKGEIAETHLYENAPHGYFSRGGEYQDACDDSWRQMLDFFDRYSAS